MAHQAPLSMEFSRQEHWSGVSFPSQVSELQTENIPSICSSTVCASYSCYIHSPLKFSLSFSHLRNNVTRVTARRWPQNCQGTDEPSLHTAWCHSTPLTLHTQQDTKDSQEAGGQLCQLRKCQV